MLTEKPLFRLFYLHPDSFLRYNIKEEGLFKFLTWSSPAFSFCIGSTIMTGVLLHNQPHPIMVFYSLCVNTPNSFSYTGSVSLGVIASLLICHMVFVSTYLNIYLRVKQLNQDEATWVVLQNLKGDKKFKLEFSDVDNLYLLRVRMEGLDPETEILFNHYSCPITPIGSFISYLASVSVLIILFLIFAVFPSEELLIRELYMFIIPPLFFCWPNLIETIFSPALYKGYFCVQKRQ